MVSTLVNNNKPSNKEGQSENGSSRPGTSERVFLATQMLRVTTLEVVLGMTQRLFLPEGHPLLNLMDRSFAFLGVQGVALASSSDPSLYHLELHAPLEMLEVLKGMMREKSKDHIDGITTYYVLQKFSHTCYIY